MYTGSSLVVARGSSRVGAHASSPPSLLLLRVQPVVDGVASSAPDALAREAERLEEVPPPRRPRHPQHALALPNVRDRDLVAGRDPRARAHLQHAARRVPPPVGTLGRQPWLSRQVVAKTAPSSPPSTDSSRVKALPM